MSGDLRRGDGGKIPDSLPQMEDLEIKNKKLKSYTRRLLKKVSRHQAEIEKLAARVARSRSVGAPRETPTRGTFLISPRSMRMSFSDASEGDTEPSDVGESPRSKQSTTAVLSSPPAPVRKKISKDKVVLDEHKKTSEESKKTSEDRKKTKSRSKARIIRSRSKKLSRRTQSSAPSLTISTPSLVIDAAEPSLSGSMSAKEESKVEITRRYSSISLRTSPQGPRQAFLRVHFIKGDSMSIPTTKTVKSGEIRHYAIMRKSRTDPYGGVAMEPEKYELFAEIKSKTGIELRQLEDRDLPFRILAAAKRRRGFSVRLVLRTPPPPKKKVKASQDIVLSNSNLKVVLTTNPEEVIDETESPRRRRSSLSSCSIKSLPKPSLTIDRTESMPLPTDSPGSCRRKSFDRWPSSKVSVPESPRARLSVDSPRRLSRRSSTSSVHSLSLPSRDTTSLSFPRADSLPSREPNSLSLPKADRAASDGKID
ncbi:hypothetical protein AAMO2058_001325700 [Amorphochlora amoebiformis]